MTSTRASSYDAANDAAQGVQSILPDSLQNPQVGIICGSGLGGLQYSVIQATDVPRHEIRYEDIRGMPVPSGM